jgi:hypothetical protein
MKYFTFIIIALLLSTISMAQIIKYFDLKQLGEDSFSTCNLKVKFDSFYNEEKRIELVFEKLDKDHIKTKYQVISVEEFIDKRYLTFRYRIKFKDTSKGIYIEDEKPKDNDL